MVENYHKNFEKILKKNFTNIFVLSILEKGPSHGYKIGNEIEKRTLGMWNPSASTLYWILNNLRDKGFIKLIEQEKNKKVYEISDTGKETLRLMKLTQRKIRNTYRRFLAASIENKYSNDIEELEHFEEIPSIQVLPTALRAERFKGNLSLDEKLLLLESKKAAIVETRDRMNEYINDFDETILKIKNELDKEQKL
ncbi:MAG TPA: PadR family transcriptional regulator [Candidatus Nanopelagicaceae bacterium]|jgi:DNA-binding PadR family transcriptional regulator|nr:PadR family transcriptional regulator [Candidatus Nanopelagicaceae bacterium]